MSDPLSAFRKECTGGFDIKTYLFPCESGESIACIELIGSVDLSATTQFEMEMSHAIKRTHTDRIVIDMSGTSHISSSSIGVFVRILKSLSKTGGNLVLACPQQSVKLTLSLLGFPRFFSVADNLDLAKVEVMKTRVINKTHECPYCGKKLKVHKVGIFKCGYCKKLVVVNDGMTVSTLQGK